MTPRDELKALLAQKELFIFDLDGTLFNTLGDLAPAVNYAMKQFGLHTHSNDDVRTFIGNGSMNLIRRAVAANYTGMENIRNFDKVAAELEREGYSEESIKEIHKVYSEFYRSIAPKTRNRTKASWNCCNEFQTARKISIVMRTTRNVTRMVRSP